jgi:hypothetical protein
MRAATVIITSLSCLSLSTGVWAQVRTGPFPPSLGQGVGRGRAIPIEPGQIGIVAIEPFETATPVIGVPYMAEAVTDTTQVLADGNRIQQRTAASIARDSKGRVRREERGVALGGVIIERQVPLITISDPATGVHVTLDPERHVAFRIGPPTVDGHAQNRAAAGVRAMGAPARTRASSADVRTEQLDDRTIGGVRTQGTRTTMTIETNAIGNQSPIVIVSERWYSPELQVVVLTRRSDPRFGETVYRLGNIARLEPDARLFDIPSDYRVEEQTLPVRSLPLRR